MAKERIRLNIPGRENKQKKIKNMPLLRIKIPPYKKDYQNTLKTSTMIKHTT